MHIPDRDTDGVELIRIRPFASSDGFRFRGQAFSSTVNYDETKDIDFLLSEERFINGGRLLVNNIGLEDRVTFQVIDKNNILGFGANTVLDEFISEYYVPQTGNLEIALAYPARIIGGLYLRLKYTSTHADGCKVKCNLYLHKKVS